MLSKENKGRVGIIIHRASCYVVLIFIALLCLFSFYILLINCTKNHTQIIAGFSVVPGKSFAINFKNIMNNPNVPAARGFFNSFVVAALASILSTYFSALTAYAIHAYEFKGKKVIFTFILMIMMVPSQITALGFIKLMRSMHLMNNYIPLIVPGIAAPVIFFFMKQYMDSSLPLEIIEAARIDGTSEFRLFNTIIMPIMKPAIAVQMIFSFTSSWNNYFVPQLLINEKNMKTLPMLIAMLRSQDFYKSDFGQTYALISFSILPVVIVYLFLSKSIVQGIALGSVKG